MSGGVLWHQRAEEDLEQAYLFIGANSPPTADRLLDAVHTSVQFLFETRGAGRRRVLHSPRAHGLRSWAVQGFPAYLLFYCSTGEDLEIVRLIHGQRDIPRLLEDEG